MNPGNANLEGLNKAIGTVIERLQNPGPALREMGMLAVSEMKGNIDRQRGEAPWVPSKAALRRGGKTLRDSGTLMNSMTFEVNGTTVSVGPTAVGKEHLTDPRIMAILAFGGDAGRGHKSHIPGWDYTFISSDSQATMREIAQHYLLTGTIHR